MYYLYGVKLKNKKCNDCDQIKPLTAFYKRNDNKNPDSVVSRCKQCSSLKHQKRMKDKEYRKKMTNNSKKWQQENPLRTRYLIAKSNALNKNRREVKSFTIEYDEIIDLWKNGCHYCSVEIINNKGVGLDRIDNTRGYELDNVLPCCGDCNKVRNTVLTVEETEIAIKAILEHRKSTGVV